jgi:hypothetical protein
MSLPLLIAVTADIQWAADQKAEGDVIREL